ncbi:hypothetical protein HDU90_006804 [Geranomyces variabilis]|nr:hypothetical protein HDU90_006804 [Geranomyces variabilis]
MALLITEPANDDGGGERAEIISVDDDDTHRKAGIDMMEVPAFRSYQPRRSSKIGFRSLASSVETRFHSFGSSLSSLGTNIKGRMRTSDYGSPSHIPDILKTPQNPLPSLCLDPPLIKWESEDLLVEDYILDICRTPTHDRVSIIPKAVFAPAAESHSKEEQNPFADTWAIPETPPLSCGWHESDVHSRLLSNAVKRQPSNDASLGSHSTNVRGPGSSISSLLYAEGPPSLAMDAKPRPEMHATVLPTSTIAGPRWDCLPADPLPQPMANGREGRMLPARPIRAASAVLTVRPCFPNTWAELPLPVALAVARPKLAARSPSYPPDDSHDTRLHRHASASTTRTAVSGASSGSSAASMYLCAMCGIGGGGGARRHGRRSGVGALRSCGACEAPILPADLDGTASVSAGSEGSLSRCL